MYQGTIFKTDGTEERFSIPAKGAFEKLKEMVGGHIEIIPFISKNGRKVKFDVLVNEDGKWLNLPVNPKSDFINQGTNFEGHQYFGNVVVIDGGIK